VTREKLAAGLVDLHVPKGCLDVGRKEIASLSEEQGQVCHTFTVGGSLDSDLVQGTQHMHHA
jgi:hypothetical protein